MHTDIFNLQDVQTAITKSQIEINGKVLDPSSREGFVHALDILHDIQERIEELTVMVETRCKNEFRISENKTLSGLQDLFSQLEQTNDVAEQDRLIENEACKHKESIAELCAENEGLKRTLWEYENNYRMGSFPPAK